jgi:hypothetical protein
VKARWKPWPHKYSVANTDPEKVDILESCRQLRKTERPDVLDDLLAITFFAPVIINSIAIYEGWIDEVLNALGKATQKLRRDLQFPDPVGAGLGVSSAIANLTGTESLPLKNNFQASLRKSRYYALPKLDAMMRCYRYFKELRNSDMHGGGLAPNGSWTPTTHSLGSRTQRLWVSVKFRSISHRRWASLRG